MDELTIGDKIYISTKRAADITGYAKDYVGQLCREGRVEATLVGRSWYVLESSVREHRFGEDTKKTGSFDEQKPILDTWSVPVYKPESVVSVPRLTVREDAEISSDTETIEDMQAAWKEWFVKREEKVSEPLPQNSFEDEPQDQNDESQEIQEPVESLVEEEPEEIVVQSYLDPVPLTPEKEEPVSLKRDYSHEEPISVAHVEHAVRSRVERSVEPEVKAPKRRKRRSGPSLVIVKALLIAVILVTGAITAIGLGFADQYAFNQDSRYEPIRFFGGVDSVEK